MSKSDKVNKTAGAAASRSKSAQKVLDIERRFIDDPIQQCCPTFEAKPHLEFGFDLVCSSERENSTGQARGIWKALP
jgi:hypothetical protein